MRTDRPKSDEVIGKKIRNYGSQFIFRRERRGQGLYAAATSAVVRTDRPKSDDVIGKKKQETMEQESTRQLKVSKELQRDIAEIIRSKGMAMFDGALVSVSGVKISPDLSVAKIYVSIFPSGKAEKVMGILEDNSKAIRGELGNKVAKQLRIVPEITFYRDDSLDYVEHIEELLKK